MIHRPPEIIDQVLKSTEVTTQPWCSSSRDTDILAACSLVCRSWRTPAQRRLLKKVQLDITSRPLDQFLACLESSPHLGAAIYYRLDPFDLTYCKSSFSRSPISCAPTRIKDACVRTATVVFPYKAHNVTDASSLSAEYGESGNSLSSTILSLINTRQLGAGIKADTPIVPNRESFRRM